MELTLDIFRNDAFSVANLQRVPGNTTYVPQALGAMGLFEPEYIDGEFVIIYEEDGVIRVIPTTERGAPDIMAQRDVHRFFVLQTRRLSKKDSVRGSELLGIADTAIPEMIRLRTAGTLLRTRTTKLMSDMELTKERHRLGALQGQVLDADGTTVIFDAFTTFGVTPPVMIDVDFAGLSEDEFTQWVQDTFWRPMRRSLRAGGRFIPGTTVGALVGDGFWAKLMTNRAFRKIWELMMQAGALRSFDNPLTGLNAYQSITFGGVTWINYEGTDDGTTISIPFNEARFFPIGASNVFKVYYSRGETLAQVQARAQSQYLIVRPDPRAEPEFVDVTLRSYPQYACIYPKALMKARVQP